MWKLLYISLTVFWIWILQSEYIPQESREPSGADQETTDKDVNKVMKFLQDILLS